MKQRNKWSKFWQKLLSDIFQKIKVFELFKLFTKKVLAEKKPIYFQWFSVINS